MNGRSVLPNVELVHRHEQEPWKRSRIMEALLVTAMPLRHEIATHTVAQVHRKLLSLTKTILTIINDLSTL